MLRAFILVGNQSISFKIVISDSAPPYKPELLSMHIERNTIKMNALSTVMRCANIKSRKNPDMQCKNNAHDGQYCKMHSKHPMPWVSPTSSMDAVQKIQKWYTFWRGLYVFQNRGPAYYDRALCTNDCDFFSTDAIQDISGHTFFSYKEDDNHIYGFDVRSIYSIIYYAEKNNEPSTNPFTRTLIPKYILQKIKKCVTWLQCRGISYEWEPLLPPTSEQQMRMKIVDLFGKINDLNYYSSPDWFLNLSFQQHRQFYAEIHALWTTRAGLSMAQKNTIVPNFHTRLFRFQPWALIDHTLDTMQKLNMGVIRTLISSAQDKNDKILGAMYVMTALTCVSREARATYPWLFESVSENTNIHPHIQPREAISNLLGIRWLSELLYDEMAFLRLPRIPIVDDDMDENNSE